MIATAFLILSIIGASSAADMTGTWGGSGTSYNSTAGPIKVNVTETTSGAATVTSTPTGTTNTNTAFFSNSSAANHASFETVLNWNTINNANNGTITFTFSRPVDNPILHIDRIGGAYSTTSSSALLTLTTSGLTITKLSGPTHFEVTSTTIQRTPNVYTVENRPEASMDSTQGTAAGSVQINGYNITSVSFFWIGVGANSGGDGIEFVWELDAPIDLAITQTTNQTTAVAGQGLTYTITVTNNGNSTILPTDTFTVHDSLPSGFTASSYTPSVGTYNSATGAWTGVTLAEGESITLTIIGAVSPTATGSLTNIASVTVPTSITDPVSTNNDATLTTPINRIADLAIIKTDSLDPVVAGQTLTYTITVTNNGPSSILSTDTFTVTDTLPSDFTASSYTPSVGTYNSATGAWTGVTLNNGDSVTLTIVGTVSSTATGTLTNTATVTPPTGVTDDNSTNDQTPPVITTVDGLPVANDDSKTTPEDTPLNGNLPISDPDGPVTVVNFTVNGTTASAGSTVNIPGVGSIKINADGTYTFTPATNYNGPVPVISYTIQDTTGNTASATLTITVTPVDDVPVAVDDTASVDEDNVLSGDVSGNDSPSGDGGNVWSVVTGPVHGTVVMNTDGSYTYTPGADYNGLDSFEYQIVDADGDISTATVTLTVNGVDDVPVAVDDTASVDEDNVLSGDVSGNDSPSG
ncbi:Ig-like domain-containing protein, partial [Methanobacterium petrolearium]|nr:putative repeat protein (TIGR01451 family) [Methanobacterium petrolearium]